MAKKKRNVSRSNPNTGLSRSKSSSRINTSAEFDPDYSYVIKDLKRIGLLAVSFFIILIALSFFLR